MNVCITMYYGVLSAPFEKNYYYYLSELHLFFVKSGTPEIKHTIENQLVSELTGLV